MNHRGFTLVEMVLTLIVGSILVLGIAGFVQLGAKGYADTVDRLRLQMQAKFVIEKMAREVRHAVPNVFTNTTSGSEKCIGFYSIKYSGFYSVSGSDLSFVVGQSGVTSSALSTHKLIINPTSELTTSNNVYDLDSLAVSGGVYTITNGGNSLVGGSVSKRHYIYDPSGGVRYCLNTSNGLMTRNDVIVADSITNGAMSYLSATLQRGGLVHLDLTFEQNGESTRYSQDVQVLNVP
ncbi:PilW family protein [Vibrio sonorensis]|uniref:PilW family protein n=1 Tax=Vibrio sonorensis TaxID=1004316 RepID=UPI0008D91E59|nr:prepilin-type N-terminal cleavage/methylation domain-containing protein [Vibrio sonorensis]